MSVAASYAIAGVGDDCIVELVGLKTDVRAVLEKVRETREYWLGFAAFEHGGTTNSGEARFWRYYRNATSWANIADDLCVALGEPKDGLTLPWGES